MRKYFGTDGIRRIANSELTPELVYRVQSCKGWSLCAFKTHRPYSNNFYRKGY